MFSVLHVVDGIIFLFELDVPIDMHVTGVVTIMLLSEHRWWAASEICVCSRIAIGSTFAVMKQRIHIVVFPGAST